MEDRIFRLEGEVSELKSELAKATTELATTNTQLSRLLTTVEGLNNTLAKGQGALWAVTLFAGVIGAAAATFIKKLFGVVP